MMELAARSAFAESILADEDLPRRVAQALLSLRATRAADDGRALQRTRAEVTQHRDFLAGALQAGSPTVFADYLRWWAGYAAAHEGDPAELMLQLELLEDQLPCTTAQRALAERTLSAGRAVLKEVGETAMTAAEEDRDPTRLAYLAAALGGDRTRAWELIEQACSRFELWRVYCDLLLWAQRRLGELWTKGEISVAQEHMASAITQYVLARLYPQIRPARRVGRALVAGVESELHVLPAHFAADLLELQGWDVTFLGTHCPASAVLSAIGETKPDVLGLSTTLLSNLPSTVKLAGAVRERCVGLPIVLGGHAVHQTPELGAELGVEIERSDHFGTFQTHAR